MPETNDINVKSPKKTNSINNIQDKFLLAAMKTGRPVNIHIINGYQIQNALIKEFDNYAIVCEAEGSQMMVYKHAVSTIAFDEDKKEAAEK